MVNGEASNDVRWGTTATYCNFLKGKLSSTLEPWDLSRIWPVLSESRTLAKGDYHITAMYSLTYSLEIFRPKIAQDYQTIWNLLIQPLEASG